MKDKDYDFKTVSAKITQADYSRFKDHCEKKGLKPSTLLKKLLKEELEKTIPINIAGRNIFVYNKDKDNFSWRVMLDNSLRVDIEDNLPAEYVSQLLDSLKQAVDERNTYIKKESKEAVPIPSKLVRGKL